MCYAVQVDNNKHKFKKFFRIFSTYVCCMCISFFFGRIENKLFKKMKFVSFLKFDIPHKNRDK